MEQGIFTLRYLIVKRSEYFFCRWLFSFAKIVTFFCFFNRDQTDEHCYMEIISAADVMSSGRLGEANFPACYEKLCATEVMH